MELGTLLVRANLITVDQLNDALARQVGRGGRLGDHLVAAGHMTEEALNAFLHKIPFEPDSIQATGLDEVELLGLMIKQIYTTRLQTVREFSDTIKLPASIVTDLVRTAVERKLIYAKGTRPDNTAIMLYVLTDEGKRWAIDEMERSQYNGPAPVTLEAFCERVNLQKVTNEAVTFTRVKQSMGDLEMDNALLVQAGPALNSGRAILLYGPPGNGKTSFALKMANVFAGTIYIPYSIVVEGQIIRVFDPSIHIPIDGEQDAGSSLMRSEAVDERWVPCRRPFVFAGGELTLEMLDLRYDPVSKLYEAPLHMKALGGCFVIDDFGRQLVSPTNLLNRWIVPLESRIDYLKLHTGKSFSIPFDELVIFSTNLEPEDLMDPAFLRRLPYKIEIGAPSVDLYKRIFMKECKVREIPMSDEAFDALIQLLDRRKIELAAYHAKFLLEQVIASCQFMEQTVTLEPQFLTQAVSNLKVQRNTQA